MSTPSRTDLLSGIAARDELRRRMVKVLDEWDNRPDSVSVRAHRLTLPIQHLDLYDWIAAQQPGGRILWSGRDDRWTMAGVGEADVVVGSSREDPGAILTRCRRYMSNANAFRYFGGFAFGEESADDEEWRSFGASRFVLPRFEILQYGEHTFFIANLILRSDAECSRDQLFTDLDQLHFPDQYSRPELPAIVRRRDNPDQEAWAAGVQSALELIDQEVIDKLVLARKARFDFDGEIDAFRLMAKLNGLTRNCYHFSFEPEAGAAFMGTTPERLFRRDGRMLSSEVLAGTRPRDEDPEADRALARALMESEKEQWEHEIVRKSSRQELHLLCEYLDVDQCAHLLQLERKQHLRSFITGKLLPDVTDGDLIERLHPTPAVGGHPRRNALKELSRLESFRRGWYAGPIGWVGPDSAEFAVAIRSGLVRGNAVSVYSGAGIVKGSEPDAEWLEIENKIVDFVNVTS